MTVHADNPEIIFFGGEFYNGKTTKMFNDLLIFNIKRGEWSEIKSPGGPPSRSAHQAAFVSAGGGQLWVFGGEFTSPSESQFYHYKDLWCFHFSSRRWEKVAAPGGPSARSGHRMVQIKYAIIITTPSTLNLMSGNGWSCSEGSTTTSATASTSTMLMHLTWKIAPGAN